MKSQAQPPLKGTKDTTIKFRVSLKQKRFWEDALKEMRFEDLSSYIRFAVDRALAEDIRSKDPRWQAFVSAVQGKSQLVLRSGLEDGVNDRLESYSRADGFLRKHHKV